MSVDTQLLKFCTSGKKLENITFANGIYLCKLTGVDVGNFDRDRFAALLANPNLNIEAADEV